MDGIIIGNGGGSVDLSQATATTSKVLYGETFFSSASDEMQTGTFAGQTKSVTPTASSQTVTPDTGRYLSSVDVGAVPTQTKSATPTASSQTITPDSGTFLSSVTVAAVPTETNSATPSSGSQTITPTSGKFLSSVTVNPISSRANSYVTGQNADQNFSSATRTLTLTPNGYVYWLFLKVGDLSARGEATPTVKRDGTTISAVSSLVTGDNNSQKFYVYRVMATVTNFVITVTNTANSTTTTKTYVMACAVK